ncbi:MAG: DUF6644 family protein [Vicinamibacterales bacterium]
MASLYPFFEWCDQTAIGVWIRDGSIWAFPLIETFHILALTLLFGTILIVDLRLLGMGMRRQSASMLVRQLSPWMYGALALILFTGILLFLSEALRCYGNDAFRFKMVCLFLALTFHFATFHRAAADDSRMSPQLRKAIALVSMTLWLCVGIGGRAIGFV